MLNAYKIAAACLLAMVAIAGCLTGESPVESPAESPVASSPVAASPKATGYTGAIVFVATDCMPCEFLKNDIDWLIHHHGWLETDFQIHQSAPGLAVPRVVFMRNGKQVGTPIVGYSQGPQAERLVLLKEICRRYPERR